MPVTALTACTLCLALKSSGISGKSTLAADCEDLGLQPFYEGLEESDRVGAQGVGDHQEFGDVDTPLTAFIFGHKGLRPFQPVRHFPLGEPGAFARFEQKLPEGLLLITVDRLC